MTEIKEEDEEQTGKTNGNHKNFLLLFFSRWLIESERSSNFSLEYCAMSIDGSQKKRRV